MTAYLDVLQRFYRIADLAVRTVAGAPPPLLLTALQPSDNPISRDEATAVRDALTHRGAALIRGRRPVDATGAAATANQLFPNEPVLDTGEHPQVDNTEALYRPVPFAPEQTLLWHHENSFNVTFPHFLIFICRVPATSGGATTIVDSRLVYQDMPATAATVLAAEGVRYTRLCDRHAGRSWQQLYDTDDPAEAQARAANNGETLTIDHDRARIISVRPAFLPTPHGPAWFNQLLHWHPAALPTDLRHLVRRGIIPAFRNCEAGTGAPIDDELVDRLVAVHREHEFPVSWHAGDILLVDNTVFAHGRNPYRGEREHFVRMVGLQHHGGNLPIHAGW
jgi:alpha-ketoglutarate-dependent taurine dioxygenase